MASPSALKSTDFVLPTGFGDKTTLVKPFHRIPRETLPSYAGGLEVKPQQCQHGFVDTFAFGCHSRVHSRVMEERSSSSSRSAMPNHCLSACSFRNGGTLVLHDAINFGTATLRLSAAMTSTLAADNCAVLRD